MMNEGRIPEASRKGLHARKAAYGLRLRKAAGSFVPLMAPTRCSSTRRVPLALRRLRFLLAGCCWTKTVGASPFSCGWFDGKLLRDLLKFAHLKGGIDVPDRGKVVVISGGTSGIGEQCVLLFAKHGAKIVFTGTNENKATKVLATLRNEGLDQNACFWKADISCETEVRDLVHFVTEKFGDCEVLCNNAGILIGGTVHETSLEDWNRIFAVNVTGTYLCCKYFLPAMIKNKRGVIINTSSISGLLGEYGMAAYCATKGAICNLTRAMALDYADVGIRVNAVCPSATRTSMFMDGTNDAYKEKCKEVFPSRRIGLPEEVAQAILFLASDEARFVNGVVLPVDGGISAHSGHPRPVKASQ